MSIATIQQAIDRGNLSASFAVVDNERGLLFGARLSAPASPRTILMVTDALQWGYEGGAQTDQSLREVANYLIWLCGKYGQQAQFILDTTGGGGSVVPGGGSGITFDYLIPVNGGVPDFTNATDYDDPRIVGRNLEIFWNDIPRFLVAGEWTYTATGIRILVAGFDATANTYDFKIFIRNPFASSGTGTEVTRSFQYTGTGGETSFFDPILVDSTIVEVARGSDYELIYSGTPTGLQSLVTLSSGLSDGHIAFASDNPLIADEIVTVVFSKAV